METKKEKSIRYLFILLFISITAGVFYYKYMYTAEHHTNYTPIATVLQESSKEHNPIVALYQFKDGQHLLIKYEIEREQGYRFKTLEVTELSGEASDIQPDSSVGLWVKLDKKWKYFDGNLKRQNRDENKILHESTIPFTVIRENGQQWVVLENQMKMKLESKVAVTQVLSLSNDHSIWLLVTEEGIKLATSEVN